MKIAMFSDCYLDLTGGIATAMTAQKRALEQRGHTVYIFSTGYPRSKAEIRRLEKQKIFVVPSCKVLFFRLTPVSRRPKVIEKWLMKKHPELADFDVFMTQYEAGCSIAGIRLGKKLGIPVVQMMHGREDMGETNIIPLGLRTLVAWNLNWFHSWYLPHPVKIRRDEYAANSRAKARMWELMVNHANAADKVVTPSEQFAVKLRFYGVQGEIAVAPNGVRDDLCPQKVEVKKLAPGETMRIIWHSRVSAEKRMMPFLRALTQVPGKWQLDVFGGGGDAFRAKRFARRHRLNVKFHGNTDFETLRKYLLRAHLDVLVSWDFDTFGMTLIEAEAAGVPVFIVDPDLAEVVPREGSVLAEGPDEEKMARALLDLLAHPERIEQMSKAMVARRGEVLSLTRVKKLEEILGEAAKNTRRSGKDKLA